MDAETGGEGIHDFEADDDLMSRSPVSVVRRFFAKERRSELPDIIEDHELYAALENREHGVVTAMGSLVPKSGVELPFLLMIAKHKAEA